MFRRADDIRHLSAVALPGASQGGYMQGCAFVFAVDTNKCTVIVYAWSIDSLAEASLVTLHLK